MSVDERLKDAGGRLADMSVAAPSFERVVGRRQRQRRIALSTLTAGVVVIATAGTWMAVGRGDDAGVIDASTETTVAPALTSAPATSTPGVVVGEAVVTFDLALPGAELVTDETLTASNAAGALWYDEAHTTYLALTVRPGVAASQPEPVGLGLPMTEDEGFPDDQGRAWFSAIALRQTMWWTRPDGAVWLIRGGWSSLEDTGSGTTMEQLRRWALGITATGAADGTSSFELDDPSMQLAHVDQAGEVRSRARVWNFEQREITLLTIEHSIATGVTNLLDRGRLLSTTVPGVDEFRVVVAADNGETLVGWALASPVEAWVTLTIPAELGDRVDAIVDAIQPIAPVGEPVPTTTVAELVGWDLVEAGPLSPRAGAVGVWTGDEVLVIGGEPEAWCAPMADCAGPEFAALTDGAAFDPDTRTWRAIAPAPISIPANTDATLAGGSVYILVPTSARPGGRGGFLRYEVATDTWTELPTPGDRLRLATLNDTVVAYSGSDENGEVTDLLFEPTAAIWQELPPDPLSPSFDRTMVASGGALYLFAKDLTPNPGSDQPSLVRAARFDPATFQWELRAPSEIIGGWFGVSIGDEIVFPQSGSADGGQVNNWGRSYASGGIYNTVTDQWSPLPDPSMDGAFMVAGALGDSAATYVGDHGHVLRLADRQWIDLPVMPATGPTVNRTIVAAGTTFFVFGGESWASSGGETLADTYIWHPDR